MADAPRFRAFFEYAEGLPVVHMSRSDWEDLNVSSTRTALIDITRTPLASVANQASVVAAYGRQYSDATAEVGVIRYDPADKPEPYNTDKYEVWLDRVRTSLVRTEGEEEILRLALRGWGGAEEDGGLQPVARLFAQVMGGGLGSCAELAAEVVR